MILNERQYAITKKKIQDFQMQIAELASNISPKNRNESLRYQTNLKALKSQLEELCEEVKEYEELKKGNITSLKLNSLEELPDALIKARIARGLTQEQLAEILKVRPQQVQRDEANKYASSSFKKLLEIQKALNIKMQEEIFLN
ncbi:MAG: hypothetical protein N5P05_004669 (plasmid) [Chroococcopsis gigantea SAG 12.99]|jgi:ribosome-binding protein aMBF1 (putative translation factor)|nr:hypothetical protein [Chroococcopsis gigantea SAG 12.99]